MDVDIYYLFPHQDDEPHSRQDLDSDRKLRVQRPISSLPHGVATVGDGWTVADVFVCAGLPGNSSFTLVTDDIETDAIGGEDNTIAASWNLLGLDDDGRVYYQGERQVLWADFVRAADAGLYRGDPARVLVFPYGAAGGMAPLAVRTVLDWLFNAWPYMLSAAGGITTINTGASAVGKFATTINRGRLKQIGERWRKAGLTGPRVRDYLSRLPQWDANRLAHQLNLTAPEARTALRSTGYEEGADGLWRLSETLEAIERRKAFDELVDEIERHPDTEPDDEDLIP